MTFSVYLWPSLQVQRGLSAWKTGLENKVFLLLALFVLLQLYETLRWQSHIDTAFFYGTDNNKSYWLQVLHDKSAKYPQNLLVQTIKMYVILKQPSLFWNVNFKLNSYGTKSSLCMLWMRLWLIYTRMCGVLLDTVRVHSFQTEQLIHLSFLFEKYLHHYKCILIKWLVTGLNIVTGLFAIC